jgi:nucleoside-diphosphate-sugar epimerase
MGTRKHYLVTGGTGFLGRSLVHFLLQAGHKVRVLDNDSRGRRESLGEDLAKVEFLAGDVRDAKVVGEACRGVDSVCHLAFINGTQFFYEKPDLVLDVGVKGMVNVLDQAIACKVPELFLMSSSEVYQTPPQVPTDETAPLLVPDPLNPRYSYGGAKLISELMAIHYGKYFERVLIVRPHNAYGPNMGREHVIPQFALRLKELMAKEGKGAKLNFPIQGSGKETRSFVFVDDFTRGVMAVLEKGKHLNIYHVGTMEERAIAEVAQEVARAYGVQIELQPGQLTAGSTLRRCPNIAKVRALGYEPQVSFAEGVRRTVEWYSANG